MTGKFKKNERKIRLREIKTYESTCRDRKIDLWVQGRSGKGSYSPKWKFLSPSPLMQCSAIPWTFPTWVYSERQLD